VKAAAALAGWGCAVALLVVVRRLRARLELVARAEHELRGPLTAFGLALHAARGTPAGRRLALVLDAELARARAGLEDLAAARSGRVAPASVEDVRADALLRSSGSAWDAAARRLGRRLRVESAGLGAVVVRGDRTRLAQAFGNVMSNAVEHGSGDISVSATRLGSRLRIEVTNPTGGEPPPAGERGRGLRIAADAIASAGGSLRSTIDARRARTILDLPLER
jgi:signal transduction histidine kinase